MDADKDKRLKDLDAQLQFFKDKYMARVEQEKLNEDLTHDFSVNKDTTAGGGFGNAPTIESSPSYSEVRVDLSGEIEVKLI